MALRGFCHNCQNRKIPTSLKEKFDEHIAPTFSHCPIYDEKFVGCTIKHTMKIDWKSFSIWLNDNEILTEHEAKQLKALKLI